VRAVVSGQITQDWMIYHARSETWLPITVHPDFERLTGPKRSFRPSDSDLVLIYPDGEVRRTPATPEPPRSARDVLDSGPLFGLSEIERVMGSELQTPAEPAPEAAAAGPEVTATRPATPQAPEPKPAPAPEPANPSVRSWTPAGGSVIQSGTTTTTSPHPRPTKTRREMAMARASGGNVEHSAVEPLPSLSDPVSPRQKLAAWYREKRDWLEDKMEDIETLRTWFLMSVLLLGLTVAGLTTFWFRNRQLASEVRQLRAQLVQPIPH
jgi:hypothetical protein